jgi:hypothetical protein
LEQYNVERLNKLLKMNGERAKILAKINNTYFVYSSNEGVVREYPSGKKDIIHEKRKA